MIRRYWLDAVALIAIAIVFLIPFVFIVLTAAKSRPDAAKLDFTSRRNGGSEDNLQDVFAYRDNMLVTALKNSLLLTVISVTIIVLLSAMVGFVAQRRQDRWSKAANVLVFSGLIIPPAVVPTIFVLQEINLFKTLTGLILVEIAITLPFGVLLTRAFLTTVPREIDEAAIIDGAGSFTLFFRVVLPAPSPCADHADRHLFGGDLQRLRQPAVLHARIRHGHRAADALQLPEPVQLPVEPVVHGRAPHHHPTAADVHLLQSQDRRGHDRRRRQGLNAPPEGSRGIDHQPHNAVPEWLDRRR